MLTVTLATIGFLMAFVLQPLVELTSIVSLLGSSAVVSTLMVDLSEWATRFRQSPPGPWNSSQFDPSRWDHYALIVVFLGVSTWGLWLSWRWKQEEHQSKEQAGLGKESRKR